MSIIYNNKVVAGKYKEQIINEADTINAGIVKIATQEEIEQGENNTSVVTPYYLSTKQDKLVAGDGIIIDENLIECTIYPDEQTIIQNDNGTIVSVGQMTKAGTIKFDWEGTEAEYTEAMKNGIIQPDWYCYITDDEIFTDYGDVVNQSLSNLKPEGEARFDAKANIDLSNLNSEGEARLNNLVKDKADKATSLEGYGITDALNKSQITNCLLEVPQRINVTVSNGTITLKAGSVVIVPYGTTDRTSEFPIGSQFVNGYWKITDTQFVENKFFVWVELQQDISKRRTENNNETRFISVYIANTSGQPVINGAVSAVSGTTFSNQLGYNTSKNEVHWYNSDGSENPDVLALPIGIVSADGTEVFATIKQVFNGMGYIGGTFWCDKGVKGLIPNGRNTDGTLKNTEFTTTKLGVSTLSAYTNSGMPMRVALNGNTGWSDWLYIQEEKPNDAYSHWYQPSTNTLYYAGATIGDYTKTEQLIFGFLDRTNGKITGWRPKQAFRALSYDDIKINNPFYFGMYIWSEFEPNNLSWLKSGGQWNSQGAYGDYYDWVLTKANAGTSGFKLSTASYTDYDFVVNTSAKTFRLPIKVKGRMGEAVVGNGMTLGFTDGTYNIGLSGRYTGSANFAYSAQGLFNKPVGTILNAQDATSFAGIGVTTDSSKSGLILDTTSLSLYFYVGETTRDTALIDVSTALSTLANKVEVVEAYVNGTSGYRIYSADSTGKRYCKQWGRYTRTTNGQETITLLKNFNNTNYNLNFSILSSNANIYEPVVSKYNTNSFTFYLASGYTTATTLNWHACGYIS